jgi:hypothetical protein
MVYIDTKKYDIYYDITDIRVRAPLFEVDEMIAPVISLLNKKGYWTVYCCSGHFDDCKYDGFNTSNSSCYIMFVDKFEFKDIKLPEGFSKEQDTYFQGRIGIRKWYKSENRDWNRMLEIMDTMKDLYDWAVKLP